MQAKVWRSQLRTDNGRLSYGDDGRGRRRPGDRSRSVGVSVS